MNNTGIIILAAGNSSRFGSIKQLLQFNNKTLVQHVIDEATDADLSPVIVVTGANAGEVSEIIENKNPASMLPRNILWVAITAPLFFVP